MGVARGCGVALVCCGLLRLIPQTGYSRAPGMGGERENRAPPAVLFLGGDFFAGTEKVNLFGAWGH